MIEKIKKLNSMFKEISLGGGIDKINKEHKKGKLTARERINYLIDDDNFYEIGKFAGHKLYEDYGGCPAGGVIIGIGKISNIKCIIVANDSTVKAGAWFPITVKKNLRAQEIAIENNLPIIYLVDSSGIFLPLQDKVFADKYHFGRIFRNNAKLSSKGITQISAIMGQCVAGGAYLPIMSDDSIIVEKTGSIFLAGSHLVKAAIGEIIDNEKLGGADTHSEISGIVDYKVKDDISCLDKIKSIISKVNLKKENNFRRIKPILPKKNPLEIYKIIPKSNSQPYNMKEIIYRLIDNSKFEEFKEGYGKTIICGTARIDGWPVGIVANERLVVKNKKGEIQLGGVIYSDSADKSARFIMNCNQKNIPLVFLQDVTGFMVGSRSEHGGIIKDGAKMVNAVANSVVPKFTIIIGNSYGAGNYAMCGKAYDPRLILAWPSAKIGVMGANQATNVISSINKKNKKKSYNEKKIFRDYENQTDPFYAASRLWIDEIIDPIKTREYISVGIEISNNSISNDKFNVGLIQV